MSKHCVGKLSFKHLKLYIYISLKLGKNKNLCISVFVYQVNFATYFFQEFTVEILRYLNGLLRNRIILDKKKTIFTNSLEVLLTKKKVYILFYVYSFGTRKLISAVIFRWHGLQRPRWVYMSEWKDIKMIVFLYKKNWCKYLKTKVSEWRMFKP